MPKARAPNVGAVSTAMQRAALPGLPLLFCRLGQRVGYGIDAIPIRVIGSKALRNSGKAWALSLHKLLQYHPFSNHAQLSNPRSY